jgi:S-adenosylmethionine hydrolase
MKIITLLTDFGSFYPAQIKGVILSRLADKAQDITFVDIAHDIPPQDVRAGSNRL